MPAVNLAENSRYLRRTHFGHRCRLPLCLRTGDMVDKTRNLFHTRTATMGVCVRTLESRLAVASSYHNPGSIRVLHNYMHMTMSISSATKSKSYRSRHKYNIIINRRMSQGCMFNDESLMNHIIQGWRWGGTIWHNTAQYRRRRRRLTSQRRVTSSLRRATAHANISTAQQWAGPMPVSSKSEGAG